MSNIIDKWKKSMEINEQTEKSIRELKMVNLHNKDMLDQNMELLNESKMELKYTQLKILQRLEEQQTILKRLQVQDEIIKRLDEQDRILERLENKEFTLPEPEQDFAAEEDEDEIDTSVEELIDLQNETKKEIRRLLKNLDDVTSNLSMFQTHVIEEQESERKREYGVIRSYFKAVLWILLIMLCLFGAYIWGFIGNPTFYG